MSAILAIIGLIVIIAKIAGEARDNAKLTYKKPIDWQKMSYDQSMNGLSNRQVEKNMWAGKYDKK